MARYALRVLAVAVLGLVLSGNAAAQGNCKVSVSPLAFGTYMPGDTSPLDTTGQIDVACAGRPGIFLLTLSTGSSGSYSGRTMQSGAFSMLYNIFRNAARTLVWGDGTGGSVISGGIKPSFGRQEFTFPVYGRIPPLQSVGSGAYLDNVLVTVYF